MCRASITPRVSETSSTRSTGKAFSTTWGLPCILKDAHGGGWKDVYVCKTLDDVIENYNTSGQLTMIVQEFIEWDQFIRCLSIGQTEVLL
jgi:glutathione synthase/RimK-type ligase-like ATP-grasp enzyme